MVSDNFKYFYYFEAELHREVVRINVGKLLDPETKNKRKRYKYIKYIVYSINDKKRSVEADLRSIKASSQFPYASLHRRYKQNPAIYQIDNGVFSF